MSRLRLVAVTGLALATAGCTGSGAPTPRHSTPVPAPSASTAATPAAAASLQHLAGLVAGASYSATYSARARPNRRATWLVWRTPAAVRIDVVTGSTRSTLITTRRGSYACRRSRATHATCFLVARPGRAVPRPFQLLAQRLFATELGALAGDLSGYAVTQTTTSDGSPAVPAATCFVVTPPAGAGVQPGTYCLSDRGLLVSVRYRTGSTVRLIRTESKAPAPGVFVPYASPTPLA